MFALFSILYLFFKRTSREVKRLEGVSRSPIYSSFSETLQVSAGADAALNGGDHPL